MDTIYSFLPYVVAAAVLFFVYQKVAPLLRVRLPAASLEGVAAKLLGPSYAAAVADRNAKRYLKQGDYLAAGKVFEEMGKPDEAVKAYVEGQEFWAAATLLETQGKLEKAGELFLTAGDHKKAAQLLSQAGKHAKAAALFQEKGNNLEAARLYGLAGDWAKAAELYGKSGYPLRAAEAYEKSGDFMRAAQCHEQHFMENVTYSTTYGSTAPSTDVKSAKLAGGLYEKAGDLGKALVIYTRGGYFKEAAAVSMQLGQFARAAEHYLRAEDPASAALAHERAGDPVKAAMLRGEVALKGERIAEAAAFFQKGQDYLRAAELYESIGKLAEAAGAYEAGDSYPAAGAVYLRAGLKAEAAAAYARGGEHETAGRLYEEVGDRARAIELFEKAGLTFKSGEAAALSGDRARAIGLLQRVGPDDENYPNAIVLLARLFIESGRPALATERLQKALAGQPVGRANLELHYWLAIGHEAGGSKREALELYRKIEAEDVHFRDVQRRVDELEAGRSTPPPPLAVAAAPSPPATGPAATPPVAAAPAPAAPVRTRFVKHEELGRGPLGVVFRGEDSVEHRPVALRMLPASLLQEEALRRALVADLKAAAQLSHPNLARVLGLVELDGHRCVVSELVTGTSLAEPLKKGQRMPLPRTIALGRALAQVLALLHGKSVVHGSVQPSNVVAAAGVLKLADVGVGRLCYALPAGDRYRSESAGFDPPGDVHSLASLLYHLLTGVHPKTHGPGAPPSARATVPEVPPALDELLLRCLDPAAERRPSSSAMARELEALRA